MRIRNQLEAPKETLLSKVNNSLGFINREDKRKTFGIPHKTLIIALYIVLALTTVIFAYLGLTMPTILMVFSPYIVWIVAYILYAPIKVGREQLYHRLYEFKSGRMGLVDKVKRGSAISYEEEFQILEWDEDYLSPLKMRMSIPTKFDELAIEGFMTQLSLHFGRQSKWTADMSDPNDAGWNFTKGHVSLVWTPHLPTLAMWDEKYLFDERIAWSFFPMGLGSENGVQITNEDGKVEHVLGFDLAGEQEKLSRKQEVQVGSEVVLSPQVLIAGGTGGGKALSVDTKVQRMKKESNE